MRLRQVALQNNHLGISVPSVVKKRDNLDGQLKKILWAEQEASIVTEKT